MTDGAALQSVLKQIEAARDELEAYPPTGFQWFERAISTAQQLVPWLANEAPELRQYTEEVLNSPSLLRGVWSALKTQIDAPGEVARFDELLAKESVLLDFIGGDTVSIVVTGHLLTRCPGNVLAGNSKSDYPDIFIKTMDYAGLPIRNKKDKYIGAAIRKSTRKPARVPDGLEIKTSRNGASIDCHYPHAGLHLMLSFEEKGQTKRVDDVMIAFLARRDYRITDPSSEATTLKASFTRVPFISLLPTSHH